MLKFNRVASCAFIVSTLIVNTTGEKSPEELSKALFEHQIVGKLFYGLRVKVIKNKVHVENTIMTFRASSILIIRNMEVGPSLKAICSPGFDNNNQPHFAFDKYWEGMTLIINYVVRF